jgi:hypothetical protein
VVEAVDKVGKDCFVETANKPTQDIRKVWDLYIRCRTLPSVSLDLWASFNIIADAVDLSHAHLQPTGQCAPTPEFLVLWTFSTAAFNVVPKNDSEPIRQTYRSMLTLELTRPGLLPNRNMGRCTRLTVGNIALNTLPPSGLSTAPLLSYG